MYEYKLVGATSKGRKYQVNEDRFLNRKIEWGGDLGDIYLAAVADGIGSDKYGETVADWLVESRLGKDNIFTPNDGSLEGQLKLYLSGLQPRFREEHAHQSEDFLNSGCTLSLVGAHGAYACCFWVGDTPIYHSRKKKNGYTTKKISTPDNDGECLTDGFTSFSPFNLKCKKLRLRKDDIVTILSDGVVYEEEMLSDIYNNKGLSEKVMQNLMASSTIYENSDDATIAALKRIR